MKSKLSLLGLVAIYSLESWLLQVKLELARRHFLKAFTLNSVDEATQSLCVLLREKQLNESRKRQALKLLRSTAY